MKLLKESFVLSEKGKKALKGKKVTESLNEDVNANDLAKFIEEAVNDFKNGGAGVWYKRLGYTINDTELYLVIGLVSGKQFDSEDLEYYSTDDTGKYVICGKIAVNDSAMQSDYELDWLMPYNEDSGDVWDTDSSFSANPDYTQEAKDFINEFNIMKNFNITDKGVIIEDDKSVEENLEERNLTRSERYNRDMNKIFDDYRKENEQIAKFLLDKGVSPEEVEELKKNTGLGRNALDDKLLELGIRDEYWETFHKDFMDRQRQLNNESLNEKSTIRNVKVEPGYHEWIVSVDGVPYYSFGDITDNLNNYTNAEDFANDELEDFKELSNRYFDDNEEIVSFTNNAQKIGKLTSDENANVYYGIINMYNYYNGTNESLKEDLSNNEIRQAVFQVHDVMDAEYTEVVVDLVDRALSQDETESTDDAVLAAIDEGLIYTKDEWAVIEHFAYPKDLNENTYNSAIESLFNDVYAVVNHIKNK